MPAKMKMVITNNNSTAALISKLNATNPANLANVPKNPTALNAPIISRIHNVQPGCGGCGRG